MHKAPQLTKDLACARREPQAEVITASDKSAIAGPPTPVFAWRHRIPVHHAAEIRCLRFDAEALLVPRPDACHGSKYSVPTEQGMEERCCDVQQDGGEKHVG